MNWTKRLLIGSGMAVTTLLVVPSVAGADASCYTNCAPPAIAATSSGTQAPSNLPFTGGTNPGNPQGSSSLPFTGADIGELAVVGAGAVLAGGLLVRRRRVAA